MKGIFNPAIVGMVKKAMKQGGRVPFKWMGQPVIPKRIPFHVGLKEKAKKFRERQLQHAGQELGSIHEEKFFEDAQDNQTLTTTAVNLFVSLNRIPEGTAGNRRVGRKILVTKINLRGYIQIAQTTTSTAQVARIMLVLDKQASGGAPPTPLLTDSVIGFNDLTESDRFMTLKEWIFDMNPQAAFWNGTVQAQLPVKHYFKCTKKVHIPIIFDGDTGAITEVRANNIFVVAWMDSGAMTAPIVVLKSRIRFQDA